MGRWNEKNHLSKRLWIKRILVGLLNLACHDDVIYNFWIGGWMMPFSIFLKEPKISVFAKDDEQKDEMIGGDTPWKCYLQHETGDPMWIPINNIAMIQIISDKEIEKMRKEAEERRKQAERGGMRLPTAKFVSPNLGGFIPPGGGRRKH